MCAVLHSVLGDRNAEDVHVCATGTGMARLRWLHMAMAASDVIWRNNSLGDGHIVGALSKV